MTIQRIDRIHDRVELQQVAFEKVQKRLDLFNLNAFERVGSVTFSDGTRIDIPSMNDSDRETAARLFAQVPAERREALNQASRELGKALYSEAQSGMTVAKSASSSTMSALTAAAQAYTTATVGSKEANEAFMGTMYMGLVGLEGDLATMAQDVKSKNASAEETRTDITEIQNELANWPDDGSTRKFSWTEIKADGTVIKHEDKALTKDQAEALMKNLEEQLTSLRDMTELAKFDLQTKMQDYQQALQTFSAILKESHDEMMKTINNLKA